MQNLKKKKKKKKKKDFTWGKFLKDSVFRKSKVGGVKMGSLRDFNDNERRKNP